MSAPSQIVPRTAISKYSVKLRKEREGLSPVEKIGPWLLVIIALAWLANLALEFTTVLTLINLLALFLAIYGLKKPGLGLIGIGMMCTVDTLTRTFLLTGGLFRWNTLNYWLVLVILINLPLVLRINDAHSRLLQVLLILMAAMLSVSLYVSLGIQDLLNMAATFGLMVYFIKAYREPKIFIWLGLICAFLAACSGLAYFLNQANLSYLNPNSFIQLPLMGLFTICLAIPQAKSVKRGRLLLLILASICVALVFLSGSRGGLVAAVICSVYLLVAMRSFGWSTVILTLGLIVLFIFSNALIEQQANALQRINKLFDTTYTLAQRTSGRSDILWTGWQIFLEEPLGIGTGSFRTGASFLNILGGEDRPAHSAWIKTLAENGIQGFLIMFVWVFSYAIMGLKSKQPHQILLGLLITAVLSACFVTTEFQGKHLWFLIAGGSVFLNPEKVEVWLSQQRSFPKFRRKRKVVHLQQSPSDS